LTAKLLFKIAAIYLCPKFKNMLTLKAIKDNISTIKNRLKKRGFKDLYLLDEINELNDKRKGLKSRLDEDLRLINQKSKEIGQLFKKGLANEADFIKKEVSELKNRVKEAENTFRNVELEIRERLEMIPNVPHESVTGGSSDKDNLLIREGGSIPNLPDEPKPHWELGVAYDIIDFDLGNKITGSGFPVFKNDGAKLQRALVNFFISNGRDMGYKEIIPPLMVNYDTAYATGQLPDKEGQMYHIAEDNFYMIPTAEVPLTNIYRDEILNETDLPVKLVGYTPCFRREAGSYGKDVRGLNRVHQFDKVEIVQVQDPEKSYETLNSMVAYVESLVKKLELPYRILQLCGGDLGFTSALTYDFEVYSAAQKKWLEVSSVSNFESFQANRLNLRFRNKKNVKRLVHTLNGSALAFPRIIAALLENNQEKERIKIPAALIPFFGEDSIKLKK
jgi:seryl-tRNA synthetase